MNNTDNVCVCVCLCVLFIAVQARVEIEELYEILNDPEQVLPVQFQEATLNTNDEEPHAEPTLSEEPRVGLGLHIGLNVPTVFEVHPLSVGRNEPPAEHSVLEEPSLSVGRQEPPTAHIALEEPSLSAGRHPPTEPAPEHASEPNLVDDSTSIMRMVFECNRNVEILTRALDAEDAVVRRFKRQRM